VSAGPQIWVELIQADEGDRVIVLTAQDFAGFEYADTDTGADIAKLSLHNHDMRWYDEPAFRAGQKLLVSWGTPGAMTPQHRMIVKKPSAGSNPITITMHDEGALFDRKPKQRCWSGMTDSAIASAIADENGYKGILQDITPTTAIRESTTQIGTDAAFLTLLARRNGNKWWIDGAGFHWGSRPTASRPTKVYVYRNDFSGEVLAQPEIEANITKDVSRVKVVAIDPRTRKEVSATVGVTDGDETLGDYVNKIIALGNEEEVADPDNPGGARAARVSRSAEIHLGSGTADDVATEAERIYRSVALNRYKMSVPVVGDPRVGAKQLHYWVMPSEVMSGLWYCKKAITALSPGSWRITLYYVKDALGKLPLKNKHPVSRQKNPNLVESGWTPSEDGMEKKSTMMEENGQLVPAWHWVDKEGKTQGKAWSMSADESRVQADAAEEAEWDPTDAGAVALPGD
jgi:hypothetical protein